MNREELVKVISKAVCEAVMETAKLADEKDAGSEEIAEEVVAGDSFVATEDTTIGGVEVLEDYFVVVDSVDEDGVVIDIFDEDGEEVEREVSVPFKDFHDFAEKAEYVFVDDEDDDDDEDIDEAMYHGKKISNADYKKIKKNKLRGRTSTGHRKLRGRALAAARRNIKKAQRKSHTASAKHKAAITRKKNRAVNASAKVTEAFDIKAGNMTFSVEEGDILRSVGNTLTVERNGVSIAEGLEISHDFLGRCIIEGVAEDCNGTEECDEKKKVKESKGKKGCTEECGTSKESKVEEGSVLTFRAGKGYVLIKEGSEIPMGNRVRARSMLRKCGVEIGSKQLDEASQGKMVVL